MANYPLVCAIALGVLVVFAWWRSRGRPAAASAALWTLVGGAVSFAVAKILMAPHAQPSLRHVIRGTTSMFHPALSLFPQPSGTAAMAGAAVTGLFLVGRRYGVAGAVLAAVIAVFLIGYEEYAEGDVAEAGLVGFAIVLCGYAVLGGQIERLAAWLAPGASAAGASAAGGPAPGGPAPGRGPEAGP